MKKIIITTLALVSLLASCHKKVDTAGEKEVTALNNKDSLVIDEVKIQDTLTESIYQFIDGVGPTDVLLGTTNGLLDTIIGHADKMCINILAEMDFDVDGWKDLLIEHVVGCGGNCCGNSFFFVSYSPDRGFTVSEKHGSSWFPPTIDTINEEISVKFTSVNEGYNNLDFEEITERIALKSGKAILLEKVFTQEIEAVKEMRSSEFDMDLSDEVRTLEFDLDGDGKPDQIEGRLWQRWGRFHWKVHFSNGQIVNGVTGALKRIGVLNTRTNGVCDLVGDLNIIFVWDGQKFIEKPIETE